MSASVEGYRRLAREMRTRQRMWQSRQPKQHELLEQRTAFTDMLRQAEEEMNERLRMLKTDLDKPTLN